MKYIIQDPCENPHLIYYFKPGQIIKEKDNEGVRGKIYLVTELDGIEVGLVDLALNETFSYKSPTSLNSNNYELVASITIESDL